MSAIEWCVTTNLWPFFDLQDMTQSWPTQQAFRGNQTLFPGAAKLPSTHQKPSIFSPLHRMSGFLKPPSLLIWALLPGISSRFSCRSGRSSAANVLPPSPGTPEVVSLTQGNMISQRSWNLNRRSVREGGQYITRDICFLHGNFSKISRRSQNGPSGRWEERYRLRRSERKSEFQAVQHRVRSEVRKHLWTALAERLMCYWLLLLCNVNLMFCSFSLQPVPCYHADLNNTGIVIYTNNSDLWTRRWMFKKYFVLWITEKRYYSGGIDSIPLSSKHFLII